MTEHLPNYRELPVAPRSAPWRSGWGVFGPESQLGTLELLTPERRLSALQLATEGVCINLDHPMNIPLSIFSHRKQFTHNIFEILPGYYDETIDGLAPQLSSQWDAFRHVRSNDGFYNNLLPGDEALEPNGALGIDQFAKQGIVGRGVLLDIERHLRDSEFPVLPNERREIPPLLLDEVAAAQGVEICTGDILLVRYGVDAFIRSLTPDATLTMTYDAPGLQQDEETLEWLWDRHVAAVCADNIAVEVTPPRDPDSRIHPGLLGLLGIPLGELFDMVELANACATRGRYEFLFVGIPIQLPGGLGSPANALAIF